MIEWGEAPDRIRRKGPGGANNAACGGSITPSLVGEVTVRERREEPSRMGRMAVEKGEREECHKVGEAYAGGILRSYDYVN